MIASYAPQLRPECAFSKGYPLNRSSFTSEICLFAEEATKSGKNYVFFLAFPEYAFPLYKQTHAEMGGEHSIPMIGFRV